MFSLEERAVPIEWGFSDFVAIKYGDASIYKEKNSAVWFFCAD
jgi:hypothetical protein